MAKLRVYEACKKFDLSSKAFLKLLRDLGFQVKGHMSVCTDEMMERVRRKFKEDKAKAIEEERRKARKIRKRTEVLEAKKPEKVKKKKKKGKVKPRVFDPKIIQEKVRETLVRVERGSIKRRYRTEKRVVEEGEEGKKLRVSEFVSVGELAKILEIEVTDLISKCMEMGLLATINQRLDFDTIVMVADEYGYEVELLPEYGAELFEAPPGEEEDLEPRPPVVTVMGHVDHGKTSLLDYLRQSNVIAGEAGGITQHIGAYELEIDGSKVTFLDTPGHEAFTAMRARGAQATDLCVLVVAADDGVMPQTLEAIDHAKAAGVPILVAINKMDLPNANPIRVKQELSQNKVMVEEFGGKVIAVEVSAKTGKGVKNLLEAILLQAEMLELRAPLKGMARGIVLESRLARGKGILVSVLIDRGTLQIGEPFVAGLCRGRVRAMFNEREQSIQIAGPSTPAQILGFDSPPEVGDTFIVVEDDEKAKEISQKRNLAKREELLRTPLRVMTLESFQEQMVAGEEKELRIVLKGDVGGSVEALADSLEGLTTEEVRLKVMHKGVGPINESDILLASASKAIVIGFHVAPDSRARDAAQRENVEVRLYNIIYQAIDEIRLAMTGLLEPEKVERILGEAEVKEVFAVSQVGSIAGCIVLSGVIQRGARVRIRRDVEVIGEGDITSLKRFKEDVKSVETGLECGIMVEGVETYLVGDRLEVFEIEEVRKETL
ncbi:translation initiation factor IF-2 [candidate division TA06 bacterium]|nr:translation initiation factor IF-2 [candidate division TA06 bacterium]